MRPRGRGTARTAFSPPSSNRVDQIIDAGWLFNKGDVSGAPNVNFDDSGWTPVSLPHTWNNLDGQDGGNNYYRGIGWYRLHYTVPLSYSGDEVFLQFDGANLVADVYVNGTFVGEHRGGYTIFRFDVTSAITPGAENVIAVKVNNAFNANIPPLQADYTFFGGIYRDVHLLVTDKLHLQALDHGSSGVFLQQTNVSSATANLQISAELQNDYAASLPATVTSVIVDGDGSVAQTLTSTQTIGAGAGITVTQNTIIPTPHLWDGLADPYLYTVYVELSNAGGTVTDLVAQPLGFRYFSVDSNNGFFLNGHYLDLHGVVLHQDMLNMGWAVTDTQREQDFSFIQELGATAIRLSAYPRAQQMYNLADQNGELVWAEIPLRNYITASAAFTASAEQQLIELIRQNYNHPSIFCWSIANEITLDPGPNPNPLLTLLNNLAHAQDPTRLTAIASATNTPGSSPTNWHTDLTAYNKYLGWWSGTYNDFAGWADSMHAAFPTRDIGVSEFGVGASIHVHSDTPMQGDHSEEYQSLFHEAYWQAMETRPFLWAKFAFSLFDFASDGRSMGDAPGRQDDGLVTYDRQTRKDAFYWYKANWSSQPFVYITSRRFTVRTQPATDIKVYSNTGSVQLLLNGVSLGSQTGSNHIFLWPGVTLAPGANVVQAIGTQNGIPYTDTVTWTLTAPAAGWTVQSAPTTNNLKGITCVSAVACTADGDLGTFLNTSSGGSSWTLQGSGMVAITPTLLSVTCPLTGTCFSAGISGTILATTNFGIAWPSQTSHDSLNLHGIACTSTTTCYAVGDKGVIRATTDGGTTWSGQTSNTGSYLTGIACPAVNTCYTVGSSGRILATTDGGATWIQQTDPISTYLRGVTCATALSCFAVGDGGAIAATADGGATWSAQTSGTSKGLKGIACSSSSACVAVGDAGAIVATTNGGATWSVQAGRTGKNLKSVACPAAGTCYAVGDAGTIVATTTAPTAPTVSP